MASTEYYSFCIKCGLVILHGRMAVLFGMRPPTRCMCQHTERAVSRVQVEDSQDSAEDGIRPPAKRRRTGDRAAPQAHDEEMTPLRYSNRASAQTMIDSRHLLPVHPLPAGNIQWQYFTALHSKLLLVAMKEVAQHWRDRGKHPQAVEVEPQIETQINSLLKVRAKLQQLKRVVSRSQTVLLSWQPAAIDVVKPVEGLLTGIGNTQKWLPSEMEICNSCLPMVPGVKDLQVDNIIGSVHASQASKLVAQWRQCTKPYYSLMGKLNIVASAALSDISSLLNELPTDRPTFPALNDEGPYGGVWEEHSDDLRTLVQLILLLLRTIASLVTL